MSRAGGALRLNEYGLAYYTLPYKGGTKTSPDALWDLLMSGIAERKAPCQGIDIYYHGSFMGEAFSTHGIIYIRGMAGTIFHTITSKEGFINWINDKTK